MQHWKQLGTIFETLILKKKTAPGCVFTVCVGSLLCVCTWMGKMQSTNFEYGSPYLAVCHITFTFKAWRANGEITQIIFRETSIYEKKTIFETILKQLSHR